MHNIATIYENQPLDKYFGLANVIGIEQEKSAVKVVFTQNNITKEVTARPAIILPQELTADDEVLVAEDSNSIFYVIGLMNLQHRQPDQSKQITMVDGTVASIKDAENGQKLCVYSNGNELMFEYDPDAKKARIFSSSDNVAFEVPKGNLELNAGGNISLKGQRVELTGNTEVGLSVGEIFENLKSRLSLKPGMADISGTEVKMTAQRATFFVEEVRNYIRSVVSKAGSVKLIADKVETTVSSIIEKAKNTYRTTENLSQVKAGRMRMLIHKTFHLGSKTTIIKAEDDVKVKGEKIHLG